MILMVSNLSECDKGAPIDWSASNKSLPLRNESVLKELRLLSTNKQIVCSPCTNDCVHSRPLDGQKNELVQNANRTHDKLTEVSIRSGLNSKATSNPKKRMKRIDMSNVSTSLRTLLSRLRPETPLSAFGYSHPSPYSQTSYGRPLNLVNSNH